MPITLEQHERKLHDPALCEQLPVRDYLDNVVVRTNGAFVAGYEFKGLASYFASDEGRDRVSAGTEHESAVPLRSSGGSGRPA